MSPLTDEQVRARIASVRKWYHPIEIRPGIVTPGANQADVVLKLLELPDDCRGLRALDLGARDGYFSFELERRGADVVAVDYVDQSQTGLGVAAELRGSRVQFVHRNIYALSPDEFGTFDIVLFLGLLYHLPDPLGALEIARGLCRGVMCLESYAIDRALVVDGVETRLPADLARLPLMQFYPARTLNDDPTNFWGPNLACLEAMVRETRFEVTSSHLIGNRGIVNCRAIDDEERRVQSSLARAGRVT